ncbi:hypothetical protein MMPV_003825 [Pyropia vietnamensis]
MGGPEDGSGLGGGFGGSTPPRGSAPLGADGGSHLTVPGSGAGSPASAAATAAAIAAATADARSAAAAAAHDAAAQRRRADAAVEAAAAAARRVAALTAAVDRLSTADPTQDDEPAGSQPTSRGRAEGGWVGRVLDEMDEVLAELSTVRRRVLAERSTLLALGEVPAAGYA